MADEVQHSLRAARESLRFGMNMSNQASYARRAPSSESIPHLAHAREILEGILIEVPDDREALIMMSQISECLLRYENAIDFINRAIDAGEPKSKKLLKRLALLRESCEAWRDLRLSPEMLRKLGERLDAEGVDSSDTTLRVTRDWLVKNDVEAPDEVIAALQRRGAFSDFQVLANVVRG